MSVLYGCEEIFWMFYFSYEFGEDYWFFVGKDSLYSIIDRFVEFGWGWKFISCYNWRENILGVWFDIRVIVNWSFSRLSCVLVVWRGVSSIVYCDEYVD